jgi:hypothetical protein
MDSDNDRLCSTVVILSLRICLEQCYMLSFMIMSISNMLAAKFTTFGEVCNQLHAKGYLLVKDAKSLGALAYSDLCWIHK